MARLTKKQLYKIPIEDLGGGIDEASPPHEVGIRNCLKCENWRVSDDGKSKEKRPGLSKIDSIYNFSNKKQFGIFGIEEPDEIELAAFLEDDIKLKSGDIWSSVFSPTKKIDKPASVVQEKGLVFVAGYEKPILIKESQALYAGVEPPQTGPTIEAAAAPTDTKTVDNPSSNQDHLGELRALNANTLLSQSFKTSQPFELTKIKLKLKKIGTPVGNLWVEIHAARGGTSLTKNASTYIVGQGTADLDVSTIAGAFATYELSFSGTKPAIDADKTYYIVVYVSYAVTSSNYIMVGFDCTEPDYEDGRYWKIDDSLDWTSHGQNVDVVFEIYGIPSSSQVLLTFGPEEAAHTYHLRTENSKYLLSQSFKLSEAGEVEKVRIPLKKDGSPPGYLWVEIHSSQEGTSGEVGASANIVGDPSLPILASTVTGDFSWIEFAWNGETKPPLSADTTYYLVLYCNYGLPPPPNFVTWTLHDGYADGTAWQINNSMVWDEVGNDFSFEIEGKTTSEVKAGEYAFDKIDDIKGLREAVSQTLLAQSFKVLKAADCSKVNLYLCKVGAPVGNIWAEIHSAQGETSVTKNLSTNIVGQASDNVDVATLNAFPNYALVTFTFSGTKPPLELDKDYYLVLYGSFAVSTVNYVSVGRDKVDPQYNLGSFWEIDGSLDWHEKEGTDLIFEVYQLTSDLSGEYYYVITFLRGGNYPCESNPSPPTDKITLSSGKIGKLTNIPVSSVSGVNEKNIYRVEADKETPKWLDVIPNSQETYEDSIPDSGLGDEVSYESYVPPAGDWLDIWDDRMWVSGVPDYEEGLFMSRQGYLEQFPAPASSYVPLREDQSDRLVRPKEFNNYLYPFKSSSIWVISRSGTSYVIDKLVHGTGLGAPSSLVECNVHGNKSLVFLSNHFRIEVFDGFRMKEEKELPKMSDKVKKTLASINKEYAYRAVAENYEDAFEYRLSIPTGTSTVPNKTIVLNYMTGNLFVDVYHQKICSISTTNISLSERATIFGTELGEALKVDKDATTDDGQIITADFWTGWEGSPSWKTLRKLWMSYILPAGKTMVFKIYCNFREIPDLNINLNGNTPSGTYQDFRNVIFKKIKMGCQGNFYSFRFINAEDVSKLKISKMYLFMRLKKEKSTVKAS